MDSYTAESTVVFAGLLMPWELGGLVLSLITILSLACWGRLGPGAGLFITGTVFVGLLAMTVGGFGMMVALKASNFLSYWLFFVPLGKGILL